MQKERLKERLTEEVFEGIPATKQEMQTKIDI
jgi:hypothetical protein